MNDTESAYCIELLKYSDVSCLNQEFENQKILSECPVFECMHFYTPPTF
jgi:hypothetical protein